jgi:hypothetical protein
MAYDYIKRTYDVTPVVGGRVKHMVTGESGVIARESPGQAHYVRVKFDGKSFSLPCHPTELEYLTPEAVSAAAK